MVSPRTSRLRFLDSTGAESLGPNEWTQSLVEVLIPPDLGSLERVRLLRQGESMRVFAQPLGGKTRVLADWPRSGTGRYRLALEYGEHLGGVGRHRQASEDQYRGVWSDGR